MYLMSIEICVIRNVLCLLFQDKIKVVLVFPLKKLCRVIH